VTSEELIKSGNSFVFRTFLVFLIVQLLILPQLPPSQRETNQIIGVEVSRLRRRRQDFQDNLKSVTYQMRAVRELVKIDSKTHFSDLRLESLPPGPRKVLQEGLIRQEKELLDSLATNAQQIVTLEKSKYSRELKIPATDVVLDEAKVRTYYASGLAFSLIVVAFFYRHPLLKSFGNNKDARPPFWAAPLAYGRYNLGFWACTRRNLMGLGLVLLVFELFIESSRRFAEFFVSGTFYVFNWSVGLVAAATYGVLLLEAIVSSNWSVSTPRRH
jgi:hypothetical protein